MTEGLYKKWWCLRDLYEQPPEVLFAFVKTKKTIRIFSFKNLEKKKKHLRFLQTNTYSKVPESISSSAQYVTQQKYFSHPSLVIYFFLQPTGPIIMIGQSEILSSSQIQFITLFSASPTVVLCLLPAASNCTIMLSQNYFPEPNWHVLTFLHPILLCTITY